MEEFNKKSDKEILKFKRRAIKFLIFLTIIFAPIIFVFLGFLLVSLFSLNIRVLLISLAVVVSFSLVYIKCYKVYSTYLIYSRDIAIPNNEIKEENDICFKDYDLTEAEVLEKILKEDSNFSKTQFYSYAKSLFVLIQEAFSNNDFKKLRFFEDDKLFSNHKNEINNLIKLNKEDIRDKINIKDVLLKDFRVENNKEMLIVAITVSMRRLFDGEVTKYNYPYIMIFSRNVGVKTKPNIKLSITNCYNCGAVIDVSDDGICNYCNTSLVSGEHEWVLVDLKLLDKETEV